MLGTSIAPFNNSNAGIVPHNSNTEIIPATSIPNVILVPFELVGKMIIVEAKVNEIEGNFIIDTGADMMVLHSRFFPDEYISLAANTVDINQEMEEMKITHVDFEWIGIDRKDEPAKVIDLSLVEESKGIDIIGFIGYPILKEFEILFDYRNKVLTLFRLDKHGNRLDKSHSTDAPNRKIKLKMAYHFPYITVDNEDESFHLLIDSGAEMNILSPIAEEKIAENLVYVNVRHLIGFGQKRIPCKEYLVRNFIVLDIELKPMHTLIQDMKGFNEVLELSLDGFLGYEFLSQHKTSINFKRKEMMIWIDKVKESITTKTIPLDYFLN